MRVDDPTLSMVATRRSAERRSGARFPSARHAPLNSSSSEIRARTGGVMIRFSVLSCPPIDPPNYTHFHPITPVCDIWVKDTLRDQAEGRLEFVKAQAFNRNTAPPMDKSGTAGSQNK